MVSSRWAMHFISIQRLEALVQKEGCGMIHVSINAYESTTTIINQKVNELRNVYQIEYESKQANNFYFCSETQTEKRISVKSSSSLFSTAPFLLLPHPLSFLPFPSFLF